MNQPFDTPDREPLDDPRELSKWTRIYAQNRSLPLVVFLGVYLLLSIAIGAPSFLAGKAARDGNTTLLAVCIAVLVPAVAAVIYLSIPRWGGKQMERIVERLYANEGHVAVSDPRGMRLRGAGAGLVLGFLACIITSVVLGLLGYIPTEYMQPVSAIYVVPFLIILTLLMRPAVGLVGLLWPVLYGLHAVLIVGGVPILFTGKWEMLNMVIPMVGYGMVAGLTGHLYSRFALHKVRQLARTEARSGSGRKEVAQG
jgi:hypothetical protein